MPEARVSAQSCMSSSLRALLRAMSNLVQRKHQRKSSPSRRRSLYNCSPSLRGVTCHITTTRRVPSCQHHDSTLAVEALSRPKTALGRASVLRGIRVSAAGPAAGSGPGWRADTLKPVACVERGVTAVYGGCCPSISGSVRRHLGGKDRLWLTCRQRGRRVEAGHVTLAFDSLDLGALRVFRGRRASQEGARTCGVPGMAPYLALTTSPASTSCTSERWVFERYHAPTIAATPTIATADRNMGSTLLHRPPPPNAPTSLSTHPSTRLSGEHPTVERMRGVKEEHTLVHVLSAFLRAEDEFDKRERSDFLQ